MIKTLERLIEIKSYLMSKYLNFSVLPITKENTLSQSELFPEYVPQKQNEGICLLTSCYNVFNRIISLANIKKIYQNNLKKNWSELNFVRNELNKLSKKTTDFKTFIIDYYNQDDQVVMENAIKTLDKLIDRSLTKDKLGTVFYFEDFFTKVKHAVSVFGSDNDYYYIFDSAKRLVLVRSMCIMQSLYHDKNHKNVVVDENYANQAEKKYFNIVAKKTQIDKVYAVNKLLLLNSFYFLGTLYYAGDSEYINYAKIVKNLNITVDKDFIL